MEEPVKVHLAQAKCYAYIYGIQNDLQKINVQMTYGNLDTGDLKYFSICRGLNIKTLSFFGYYRMEISAQPQRDIIGDNLGRVFFGFFLSHRR